MWRKSGDSKTPLMSADFTPPAAGGERSAGESREDATSISRATFVKGEVSSRENVFVDGEFHGTIRVTGAAVVVGPHGRVTADIEADEIVVEGRVEGSLHARSRAWIARTGSVLGDVIAPRVAVEDGAGFRGRVEMARAGNASEVQASTPASRTTASLGLPVETSEQLS